MLTFAPVIGHLLFGVAIEGMFFFSSDASIGLIRIYKKIGYE